MSLIVGIHNSGPNAAAAIVQDGRLVFACQEERLTRQKHDKNFPHRSIAAGLKHIGASIDDVTDFALGWNPAVNISRRYRAGFSEWPAYPGARLYTAANHLLPQLSQGDYTATEQRFHRANGRPVNFWHINHHTCHAATAYYLSGFPRAGILTWDGYGERASIVWHRGEGNAITLIKQIDFPNSVGSLWAAITQFLGFEPERDEWKVMGMAAYGDPDACDLGWAFKWDFPNPMFTLPKHLFRPWDFDAPTLYTPGLAAFLKMEPRRPDEPLEARHYNLAAGVQAMTSGYLVESMGWLPENKLCVGGGCGLNCLANGDAVRMLEGCQVFIPHAPDDCGNAIGAALWLAAQRGELPWLTNQSPYLGPEWSDADYRAVLEVAAGPQHWSKTTLEMVATRLAKGAVIGWHQGRMEFGQRALGNRSILADPRNAAMKDRINQSVKHREAFRPFAPSVLAEHAAEWFEGVPANGVPYMELALPVRPEKRGLIPAVTHADGTARLQTVTAEANPRFHALLMEFHRLTGVPMLLNTSFNQIGRAHV